VKFVNQVHDSAMQEMDDSEDLMYEVKDIVEMVLKEVVPNDPIFRFIKVPIEADYKTGKSWGELQEVK